MSQSIFMYYKFLSKGLFRDEKGIFNLVQIFFQLAPKGQNSFQEYLSSYVLVIPKYL